MFLNLLTSVTVNLSSCFLQLIDRATEKTTGNSEDVDNEGQHDQHLCCGKFDDYINIFFSSPIIFLTLMPRSLSCCSVFVLTVSLLCPSGVPALVLSHHLPISQSIWPKRRTEEFLHSLFQ